jgi:hypothetical protein
MDAEYIAVAKVAKEAV